MNWDSRLDALGVTVEPAAPKPGEWYWRLETATYYAPHEAGGRHHIFVRVDNSTNEPMANARVRVWWQDGASVIYTKSAPGWMGWYGDFAMYGTGYSIAPGAHGQPADVVHGLGNYHNQHNAFGLQWQLTRHEPEPEPEEPGGNPPDGILTLNGETYHVYKV